MRSPKRRSLAAANSEPSPNEGSWLARTGAGTSWACEAPPTANISQQAKPMRLIQPRGRALDREVVVVRFGEDKSLVPYG
jgi:hypothetical protein